MCNDLLEELTKKQNLYVEILLRQHQAQNKIIQANPGSRIQSNQELSLTSPATAVHHE